MDFVKHTPWLIPLIVVGSVGLVSVVRPTEPMRALAQTSDKASGTEQQQSDAKQSDGSTVAKSDKRDAKIYSPDCNKPENHPEADLCVQRRMANAAESQNLLNSVGLGGLAATLIATGLAALAAWRTVWTMQDTAKRELRAYLATLSGAIEPQASPGVVGVMIDVTMQNSGQTPAYDFRSWIDAKVDVATATPFQFPTDLSDRAFSIVGPGVKRSLNRWLRLTDTEMNELRNGTKTVFVWGRVEYRDVFGVMRFYQFRDEQSAWFAASNRWGLRPHKMGHEGD